MANTDAFKQASTDVRNLDKTPTDEDFAKMYSLYKQATDGDCNRDKPGADDKLGQAKHEAWGKRNGMSKEDAAEEYISAAKDAVEKYGKK